ncbi:hypothetical protein RH858_09180 [Halalkaliarchaeum sp. AArc-GB]|uniref:DUF7118 family protein n=1 Tax=Halalkaliarchaeum sp. AArc-GB TaxID=3074078 RepID=UPI0028548AE2|nr:hypothetical protein [Halalkaliarchaeum sp. AArc-GB]MDR5673317.1 hypothetical protein [Halalkaliarchaeum sp. AArc-GB]
MADGTDTVGGADTPGSAASILARAGEAAAELRERYDELRAIERRIDDLGTHRVEAAADAYRRAHRVLDSYEDDATGTGDFGAYLTFESKFSAAVDVADDALAVDAFEAAREAVDKRRLSASDFAAAREALETPGEYVELLEERDDAVDAYRLARRNANEALSALDERIETLERVADFADVDPDAPVDRLREPIEAYNDAVNEAFESFKREASARALFEFIERTERYPLVEVDQPPRELQEYVEDASAGEEPLPTLLEYVDYSPSKLEHYVDDPGALRTTVAVHRTYLDRIDAAPLSIEWPPAAADELQYRIKELIPVVSRLDAEEPVVHLREIRSLTREDEYATLRRGARAREELSDEGLELLASGELDARLAEARETRELVAAVLTETDR